MTRFIYIQTIPNMNSLSAANHSVTMFGKVGGLGWTRATQRLQQPMSRGILGIFNNCHTEPGASHDAATTSPDDLFVHHSQIMLGKPRYIGQTRRYGKLRTFRHLSTYIILISRKLWSQEWTYNQAGHVMFLVQISTLRSHARKNFSVPKLSAPAFRILVLACCAARFFSCSSGLRFLGKEGFIAVLHRRGLLWLQTSLHTVHTTCPSLVELRHFLSWCDLKHGVAHGIAHGIAHEWSLKAQRCQSFQQPSFLTFEKETERNLFLLLCYPFTGTWSSVQ